MAFSICIVAFILVCLSTEFYEEKPSTKDQLIHLLFSIPLGLAFVLIKYLYENSFVDAFSFLFFDGILCIILPFITICIIAIFKGTDYFVGNMEDISYLFDNKVIGKFFLVVIFSFGYYLTNALTIYLFNPSLMVMTDILSPIFRWVIEIYNEKEQENFLFIAIFKISGFLLIIFTAFVFNEFLILHFCGLDKNIQAKISERAKRDMKEINESNSFSFSRDDDENLSRGLTFESEMNEV